jgi:hypothetical protein
MVQPHAPAEIYQLHNLEEQDITRPFGGVCTYAATQHRYVARVAPDRIRLERLSPPLCDAVVKLESNSFAFSCYRPAR